MLWRPVGKTLVELDTLLNTKSQTTQREWMRNMLHVTLHTPWSYKPNDCKPDNWCCAIHQRGEGERERTKESLFLTHPVTAPQVQAHVFHLYIEENIHFIDFSLSLWTVMLFTRRGANRSIWHWSNEYQPDISWKRERSCLYIWMN